VTDVVVIAVIVAFFLAMAWLVRLLSQVTSRNDEPQ
jgi:flagellar biogenesis protein FliO